MKIIADKYIPFLQGRLEPFAQMEYIDPCDFTAANVKDADALLIRTRTRCNEALLSHSNVKFIATATIGTDQFDMPWCHSHGISTANAPGCNAPGVAQYVWSAILRSGRRSEATTVGVVGCGNVGRIVAEWGHKLGFRILVNDPPLCAAQPQIAAQYPYEFVSLEELLKESDVVTLHTPLTKEGPHATFHLIASPQVSLMKHGATLINAARGPVIDTEAVIEAMHTRGIHAFIDTWEGEPDRLNLTLLHEADIATFHVAGYSLQGKQRATRMACEALARHFGLKGVKLDDLPQPYTPVKHISEAEIVDSYNPLADTESLRKDPSQFEHLRDNYQYRSEPEFVAEK